ncbi:MAG: transcription elongation factor GreA [Candidatus Omnitrophica bacterium]|nr:transcription elongation factor GreA [Candidatus Omnitrophota bacterium]
MHTTTRLTREGYEKLKNELHHLKTVRRREIIEAIAVAREKGDLRENAEYDAAKNEQGYLEKRIHDLETKLAHVTIIDDANIDGSKAFLGATIYVKDLVNHRELDYMLVSKEEADLKAKKISVESPVGRALLGKSVGAEVEVVIPAGTLKYKIIKIERF